MSRVFKEFDTYEEAEQFAKENLIDGEYDINPALHTDENIWKHAIIVPDDEEA